MVTQLEKRAAIYRASNYLSFPRCSALPRLLILPSSRKTCCMLILHLASLSRELSKRSMCVVGVSLRDQFLITQEAPDKKGGKKEREERKAIRALSCIRQRALGHSTASTASPSCDSSTWSILNCDLLKKHLHFSPVLRLRFPVLSYRFEKVALSAISQVIHLPFLSCPPFRTR